MTERIEAVARALETAVLDTLAGGIDRSISLPNATEFVAMYDAIRAFDSACPRCGDGRGYIPGDPEAKFVEDCPRCVARPVRHTVGKIVNLAEPTADPPWLDEDGAIEEWAIKRASMLYDGMIAAGEGRDAAIMAVLAFAARQPRDYEVTPEMISAAKHSEFDAAYNATSWSGFNLFGDEKSIKELHRLMSQDSRAVALQHRLDEELQRARQPRPITEALYVALRDIMEAIATDALIPESVSYMQQARAALEAAEKARGDG